MASPSSRSLHLASLVLAGTVLLLPWTLGGRSPTGLALAVLLPAMAVGPVWVAPGSRLRPATAALLLGAAILAASSAAQTISPDRTIQSLLLLLAYTAAGSAAAHCARSVPWARPLLLGAIALSGLAAGLAGTQWLLRGPNLGIYANQLTGPFGYPNAMAGSLLLATGAAAALAEDRHRPALRFAALVSAGLLAASIWLTGSRGAGLALGLGVLTWAASEVLPRWRRPGPALGLAILGAGALGAAAACLGVLPLSGGWPSAAAAADPSVLWRRHVLRWTWEMIQEQPWLGVGPGGFPIALTHYQRLPYVSGENPHNLLAQIAAEFGLPAALLLLIGVGMLLAPIIRRLAAARPDRRAARPVAALLATLVAFLGHSLLDMAWSFPAVAMGAAILCGLAAASVPGRDDGGPRRPLPFRIGIGIVLAAAMLLAMTRFYASSLVESGRQALAFGATSLAVQDLSWAVRLNPASFPAHRWLALARLRAGDAPGALAVAERAARLAPADPNSTFLAGEMAAAAGQWARADRWFRAAALRAPFAQLRFHAGAVEAAARSGDATGAREHYAQAVAAFTPERVVHSEARCLAPGDRYLLARMSWIAADVYAAAGDHARSQEAERVARQLVQPDTRGICALAGGEGQASPEAAMLSFWGALGRGGWREAEQFLDPTGRDAIPEPVWRRWAGNPDGNSAAVSRVVSLSGNEFQVSLTVELLAHARSGEASRRCAQASLRFMNGSWFLEDLPQVLPGPCPL